MKKDTEKDLLEKLESAKKIRAEKCINEINALLEKYNCIIRPDVWTFNDQKIGIQVIAK